MPKLAHFSSIGLIVAAFLALIFGAIDHRKDEAMEKAIEAQNLYIEWLEFKADASNDLESIEDFRKEQLQKLEDVLMDDRPAKYIRVSVKAAAVAYAIEKQIPVE